MSVLYNIEPLTLNDTSSIPDRLKTIIIIRPKDTIPQKHFVQLDNFLSRGGKMFIAFSRVNANLQNAYGGLLTNGLDSWLKGKGILVSNNIVIDASCSAVQVVQQQGGFKMVSNIQFPYFPVIKSFAKHPISGSLEVIAMPFVSPIEYIGDASKKFTPIAFTSEKSGMELLPVYFNIQKQWTQSDFQKKNIVIAATLEGKLAGNTIQKSL